MHAFTWVIEPDLTVLTGGENYRDELLRQARVHLESAAALALEVRPGLDVQQQLIIGYPAEVLAAEARRARLLVLGDRGLNRIEGVLVGSTAGAMVAHAECPIVVVRGAELGEAAGRSRPVVVGVDDSPSSEAAIGFAFEAAAARGRGQGTARRNIRRGNRGQAVPAVDTGTAAGTTRPCRTSPVARSGLRPES